MKAMMCWCYPLGPHPYVRLSSIESERIQTLWTVNDTDRIRALKKTEYTQCCNRRWLHWSWNGWEPKTSRSERITIEMLNQVMAPWITNGTAAAWKHSTKRCQASFERRRFLFQRRERTSIHHFTKRQRCFCWNGILSIAFALTGN